MQNIFNKIQNTMSCTVVRPSNIFGPGDKFDPAVSHVTAALVRKVALRMTPLEVWGTGEDIRDLIFIDDFIEGMLKAFAVNEKFFVVNLCSGNGISVKNLVKKIAQVDNFDSAEVI